MNKLIPVIRAIGVILLIMIGFIVLLNILYVLSPFGGYAELLMEFVSGFWFFLRDNLPSMSWDAGTWGPGLGAFILALVFTHQFFKTWAVKTNRFWSFGSSFCVMLTMPVLFVIAFIVPGILLQWETLRHAVWLSY